MPTLHLNTALAASFALTLNAAVYPALSLANTASSMKCIHVLLPEVCPACECTWRQFTWCFASHCSKAAMLQESRDVLPCQHEADLLRSQLAETQAALRAVTHRAESAESDLEAALVALGKAEKVLDKLVYRKDVAEIVGLVSGCVAAFLGAAGMTVYLLQ